MFEFDWDEANIAHIARHDVTPNEAEEACSSDTLVLDLYDVDYEERLEEVGQTRRGRILKVISVERGPKTRVVTAYDAAIHEVALFLRSKIIQ